jgi:hypothetical protein
MIKFVKFDFKVLKLSVPFGSVRFQLLDHTQYFEDIEPKTEPEPEEQEQDSDPE